MFDVDVIYTNARKTFHYKLNSVFYFNTHRFLEVLNEVQTGNSSEMYLYRFLGGGRKEGLMHRAEDLLSYFEF